MPKKGGKKAKEPAFYVDAESCRPFGFSVDDILITPLGLQVTVVGVKKSGEGPGQMWASYPGGFICPLRPRNATEFEEQGYRKAHGGIHILRDKELFEVRRQQLLESVNPIAPPKTANAAPKKKKDKK